MSAETALPTAGRDRTGTREPQTLWYVLLALILALGLLLRLKGIHNPLLDHPGWRQGDTAAIARNFATLDFNLFHPQVDYNGPPPNYVELELQIVPFLAALLYKLFGIHEIFGRLIALALSLANVVLLAYFARRLFRSEYAGLTAGCLFAIYPGSLYYGRTFLPDTAMVCLATAALYASFVWILDLCNDRETGSLGVRIPGEIGWKFWLSAALTALAILAKPMAALILAPIIALAIWQVGWRGALLRPAFWGFLALAIVPYLAYDAYLRSIAEWHWASGISAKHVVPEFVAAFVTFGAFGHKVGQFNDAIAMLHRTMLGPIGFALLILAIVVPLGAEARVLVASYFLALLAYTFVVVTVERVDYYLYLWLPLAALWSGGLVARIAESLEPGLFLNRSMFALAGVVLAFMIFLDRAAVHEYYQRKPAVYRAARALDAALPPGILVVMAHYDPSVLYYINRKGWEEDPALWTPFDEQSAIRKGARAFISIEDRKMRQNLDLCHWLERFPVINPSGGWPVYVTDPANVNAGAEARWQAFRKLELAGRAKPCPPNRRLVFNHIAN